MPSSPPLRSCALSLLLVAAAAPSPACAPLPPPFPLLAPPHSDTINERIFHIKTAPNPPRIAIVSDAQRTSALEFWRESNDPERARIIAAIADARPDLLVILGDLVFDGSSPYHWAHFDVLARPLRERGIPVVAALGNHEYWLGRASTRRFFARLPHQGGRHFFRVVAGPLHLLVLDSNLDRLTDEEREAQRAFYTETLAAVEHDPSVRGALVLTHHPRWTNSTVTADEPQVEAEFVPPLLRSRKALALISGHVHASERFSDGGKVFVVAGGGGGPRAALRTGERRRHPDLVDGPPIRPFHFLLITVLADGLDVDVRGLPKGGHEVVPIDRFHLPFPSPDLPSNEPRPDAIDR